MAYTYGIPDGTYTGRPTTASCYEKDGRLILDVNFAVKDPNTGAWYKKDNGYDWEARKRFWLTSADGAFNEKTIEGLKEWAKGWNPRSFDDFYWFQSPDANGTPFGNLAAIGEVELNLQTDNQGNQTIWVHDPNRPKAGGRRAFVPDGATTDRAQMMAKWGTRAKALFAATPKKVSAPAAAPSAGTMVPQDSEKAVEWYTRAAEKGNARSMMALGYAFRTGQGVPADPEEAVRWYEKAALAGRADALEILNESAGSGQ